MRRGRELTRRKWNGSVMSGAINGQTTKPLSVRIPAMLSLWPFSPTTVPASFSNMLCPSVTVTGQYYADFFEHQLHRALRNRPNFLGESTSHSAQRSAACRWRSEPVTGQMAIGGALPSPIFTRQHLRFWFDAQCGGTATLQAIQDYTRNYWRCRPLRP